METVMKPVQNGRGRRRRWSAEQKLAVLQEWQADLPPINQVGSGVRIPADGRRGHGTKTVYSRGDHQASADHRD
jgi:hypothetical protein